MAIIKTAKRRHNPFRSRTLASTGAWMLQLLKPVIGTALVVLCSGVLSTTLAGYRQIRYELELDEKTWDATHIQITITPLNEASLVFYMPAWRPGVYVRQDFGRNVRDVQAANGSGQRLSVTQLHTNMWRVESGQSAFVRLKYTVDQTSAQLIARHVDSSSAVIDGAMNFMAIRGFENQPLRVQFHIPIDWKVAISLPATMNDFEFIADCYSHLIDSPALIAPFEKYYFLQKDRRITIYFDRPIDFNVESFLVSLRHVAAYQIGLFRKIPFPGYDFFVKLSADGHAIGGLEHRNSSLLFLPIELLQQDQKTALHIAAHEFFHVWNVKRIVPISLIEPNLLYEPRTTALWFSEGVTSYYADLSMVHADIWSIDEFLEHLSAIIEQVANNKDRMHTSAEQASLAAWENGYHHSGISYYDKGELLGALLDLSIRYQTDNTRSLDDVMRFLYNWFGSTASGFRHGDILRAVNSVTGHNYTRFFDQYVAGLLALPYREVLAYAGVDADVRADTVGDIGAIYVNPGTMIVRRVDAMSAAAKAGLRPGDRLIAIDDAMVATPHQLNRAIESRAESTEIRIQAERNHIPITLYCPVTTHEKITAHLRRLQTPTQKQLRIRRAWLLKGEVE